MNVIIRSAQDLEYIQDLVRRELKIAYDELDQDEFNAAYSAAKEVKLPNLDHYDDFEERVKEAREESQAEGMAELLRDYQEDL
jgi:hypothetical protein